MATTAKTIIATGVSSGLGFEAIKQLLGQAQPYRVILGARNTQRAQHDYDALSYDRAASSVTVLPCELNDLRGVKTFAQQALEKLGQDGIDYLFLSAAITKDAKEKGPYGSKWCESLIVNHYSQHYLVHLLREKLVASKSRIVVVSSGAVRSVPDVSALDKDVLGGSGTSGRVIYAETKFIQLLGAHWWRRQLAGQCDVVAVSPGLIPSTGIDRNKDLTLPTNSPDAKTIPEGAQSILAAFTRSDFPEDPQRIFLTSWGEWWSKDVYGLTLDEKLQDKWCPTKEALEKEENIV